MTEEKGTRADAEQQAEQPRSIQIHTCIPFVSYAPTIGCYPRASERQFKAR